MKNKVRLEERLAEDVPHLVTIIHGAVRTSAPDLSDMGTWPLGGHVTCSVISTAQYY